MIGKDTQITPPGEMPRPMARATSCGCSARADRDTDGTYRVILSKAAPGRPVGRIEFQGTRADDPNDVVPHEHQRELRGYFVFAAWLNHVDAKGINSLSTLVTENGRTFIRHYLLDFGSALGSAAVGPREGWEGYEPLVETTSEIGKRVLSLGVPHAGVAHAGLFRIARRSAGCRANIAKWDPEKWWPHITNAAFRQMRAGRYVLGRNQAGGDHRRHDSTPRSPKDSSAIPTSEEFLAKAISDRRLRILQTFLPKVNPIVDPSLDARAT